MAKFCSGVYAIVNLRNGKLYIGSAVVLTRRRGTHFQMLRKDRHHITYLQNSWNRYGPEAFLWTTLEFCEPEQCFAREQYWLDRFESYKFKYGYNQSPTAGSCLGFKHSEKTKAKMSKRMAGVPMQDWVKEKIGQALTGRVMSAEHRANIWKNKKGWRHSESSKKKVSESLKKAVARGDRPGPPEGWKHSEESRRKIGEKNRGVPKSPEHRAKIAAAVRSAKQLIRERRVKAERPKLFNGIKL